MPVNGEAVASGLIVLITLSLHVDMILPLQNHFLCSASTAALFNFTVGHFIVSHSISWSTFLLQRHHKRTKNLINNVIVKSEQLSVTEVALKLSSGLTNRKVV